MNADWVDRAMAHTRHQRIIPDMDSFESSACGEQEGAAYKGHFECVCYHLLYWFNQFGDCEGAKLRPGNVYSAYGWREVLEPMAEMPRVVWEFLSRLDNQIRFMYHQRQDR